jgi:hypothetical protein
VVVLREIDYFLARRAESCKANEWTARLCNENAIKTLSME